MKRLKILASSGLALGLAVACSESDGPDNGNGTVTDMGGGGTDMGMTVPDPEFDRVVLDGLGTSDISIGDVVARIAPGGLAAVAYAHLDGQNLRGTVRYIAQNAASDWSDPEEAGFPGNVLENMTGMPYRGGLAELTQVAFDFVGASPRVAYQGGVESMFIGRTFPTDLMMSTGSGTWSERTLVATSGETTEGECPMSFQAVCDFGDVVGAFPALASGPGNTLAVAYRDQHQEAEAEVSRDSDLEVYLEGTGGTRRILVDPGRGAGQYMGVAFGPAGNVIVAYAILNSKDEPGGPTAEENLGIWAAVEGATGAFERFKVSDDVTNNPIDVAVRDDGRIAIVYYDTGNADLVLALSDDAGATWNVDEVDERGFTGFSPSVAFDAEGNWVISFGYCGRPTGNDCPGSFDSEAEVRIARQRTSGVQIFTVDDGQGFGGVGDNTSLVIYPDGHLGVAFTDSRNGDLVFAEEIQ